ncbi:MAG TPA: TIM barrel protein [Microvirga sp.]|nr:TIM barrel protein [Microvirga sp.]
MQDRSGRTMASGYSAHLGYMFNEHPLEQRFAAAAAAGFSAVEHPSPYPVPAATLRRILADCGLTFVQMALPAGDPGRGEKGIAGLPGREAEFDASLARGLDYAEAIGCRMVHVMAGVVPEGSSRDACWPLYCERLAQAAAAADARGMTLLIEPIGIATIANYLLDDPYLGLRALDAVDAPNVRLLLDAFHCANSGIDAARFVERHRRDIAHVHIADHPGRHEPGTGTLDFTRFFSALATAGYGGAIGLEYIPAGETGAGLAWMRTYPDPLGRGTREGAG